MQFRESPTGGSALNAAGGPACDAQAPRLREVALPSGLAGLLLGCACGWQTAVESAQVLAGVVAYPVDNPFYMYHVKVWTLLHQGPALLLSLGVSEAWVCVVLGGLAGMIACLCISLSTLALSGRRWLSIAMPLLMISAATYLETHGVYPLRMLSDKPWVIYGAFGTSYVILAWALLALGRWRTAGVMIGLAPAVHPTMGAWCLVVAVAVVVTTRFLAARQQNAAGLLLPLAKLAIFVLLGGLLAASSLAAQFMLARRLPEVPPAVQTMYLTAYANAWDTHRQPFPLTDPSILFAGLTLALWLVTLRGGIASPKSVVTAGTSHAQSARLLLGMLAFSTLAALILCLLTHVPQWLPSAVVMAMPGRFINLTTLLFPALVAARLATLPRPGLAPAATAALLLGFILRLAHEQHWVYFPELSWLLSAGAFFALAAQTLPSSNSTRTRTSARQIAWRILCAACALALLWVSRGTLAQATVVLFGLGCLMPSTVAKMAQARAVAIGLKLAIAAAVAGAAYHTPGLTASLAVACLAVTIVSWPATMDVPWLAWLAAFVHRGLRRPYARVAVVTACCLLVAWQARATSRSLRDWRNDPFFAAVHQGQDCVVTVAGIGSTQLRGRRPVLLEVSSLNQLPYVPESGPRMNAILREVYGEDLLHQPRGGRRRPGLDAQGARPLWESRDADTWRNLGRKHGFSSVIAYSSWNLQLPAVATNGKLTLYTVPRETGGVAQGDAQSKSRGTPALANRKKSGIESSDRDAFTQGIDR